jgi:DNA-directed RNA polymerase subunit RPC12/RpoP
MMSDLIKREDAKDAVMWGNGLDGSVVDDICEKIDAIPSADRPSEVIYGNEHNCIMTIFGKRSYAETGCGDCAVVEKVRKALSADRPQGEWIKTDRTYCGATIYKCPVCGADIDEMPTVMGVPKYKFCPSCGARMKGADDES